MTFIIYLVNIIAWGALTSNVLLSVYTRKKGNTYANAKVGFIFSIIMAVAFFTLLILLVKDSSLMAIPALAIIVICVPISVGDAFKLMKLMKK